MSESVGPAHSGHVLIDKIFRQSQQQTALFLLKITRSVSPALRYNPSLTLAQEKNSHEVLQ
jgi:hypothetical protein